MTRNTGRSYLQYRIYFLHHCNRCSEASARLQRQQSTPIKRGAPCGWTLIAISSVSRQHLGVKNGIWLLGKTMVTDSPCGSFTAGHTAFLATREGHALITSPGNTKRQCSSEGQGSSWDQGGDVATNTQSCTERGHLSRIMAPSQAAQQEAHSSG